MLLPTTLPLPTGIALAHFQALLAEGAPCVTESVVPFPPCPHRSCLQAPPWVSGCFLCPQVASSHPRHWCRVFQCTSCCLIFPLQMWLWSPGWGGGTATPQRASGQNCFSKVVACMCLLPRCPRKGLPCTPPQGRLHLTVTPAGSTQVRSRRTNPTSSRAFVLTSGSVASVAGVRGFETGRLDPGEESASRPHLLCDVSLELQQRAATPA